MHSVGTVKRLHLNSACCARVWDFIGHNALTAMIYPHCITHDKDGKAKIYTQDIQVNHVRVCTCMYIYKYCSLEFGGTTVLQFPADVYPIGFERELPLIFTRNPDGPQNYFFQIALRAVSPPNAVDVGGVIGMESPTPVFAVANITIVDDGELHVLLPSTLALGF